MVNAKQGSDASRQYVREIGPHYASGCYLLLEADVDVDRLRRASESGGTEEWHEGPIALVKRPGKQTPVRVIDGDERSRSLGPELRRLVHGKGRRFHRYVRHTLRSLTREGAEADRAIVVTGFEILQVDADAYRIGREPSSASPDIEPYRMRPAVVIVHFDPTASPDDVVSGHPEISEKALANTLRRLMRDYYQQLCALIGRLLVSTVVETEHAFNTTRKEFEFVTGSGECAVSSESLRVLGTADADTSALVPIYSVLTVTAKSAEDVRRRLREDRASRRRDEQRTRVGGAREEGDSIRLAPEECSVEALLAARATALATLDRKDWINCSTPDGFNSSGNPPIPWRGWSAAFSRAGAGFAAAPGSPSSPWDAVDRRTEISGSYADILALEVLKGRILKDFSDRLHRTAEDLLHDRGQHDTALKMWQEFALFTTDYASGVPVAGFRGEKFLESIRAALGDDSETAIERTQANLDRLAQIARLRQDEERRLRDQADRERIRAREEERRAQQEADAKFDGEMQIIRSRFDGRFAIFVGMVATIFLPPTVIPPILEWFYENPDPVSVGARTAFTVGGMALFALVFGLCWMWMKWDRDRAEAELKKAAGRS